MSIAKALAVVIPKHVKLDIYHFSCPIKPQAQPETHAINRDAYTIHFFVACQSDHILFGLEVFVYAGSTRTIYVSKVDTTGCHERARSPIAGLTLGCLRYLIQQQQGNVQLQLFAKSQPQYLFPFSSQNANKHVLSDRGLVKWWVKTIDGLSQEGSDIKQYLMIPGLDTNEVQRYVSDKWIIGHPYRIDARACEAIRRFPDDPKGRFLEQLELDNAENIAVEQFWELLAHRQEMASGHEIGFITLSILGSAKEEDNGLELSERMYQKIQATIKSESFADAKSTLKATRKFKNAIETLEYHPVNVIGEKGPLQTETEKRATATTNILVPRKKKKS